MYVQTKNVFWPKSFFDQEFVGPFFGTKSFRINDEFLISNFAPQTKMHLTMEFDSSVGPTCFF